MASEKGSIKIDLSAVYSKLATHSRKIIDEYVVPNVVSKINERILKTCESLATSVQETIIKPKVPVKSGKLRNAIKVICVKSVQKNIIFRIYAGYPARKTIPYAVYLEEGTKKHTITSNKVISFKGYAKLRRKIKGRGKYSTKKITSVFIKGKSGGDATITVRGIKKLKFLKAGADYISRNLPKILAQDIRGVKFTDSDARVKKTTAHRPKKASIAHFSADSGLRFSKDVEAINVNLDYDAQMRKAQGD